MVRWEPLGKSVCQPSCGPPREKNPPLPGTSSSFSIAWERACGMGPTLGPGFEAPPRATCFGQAEHPQGCRG